jgi:hypothetical protein
MIKNFRDFKSSEVFLLQAELGIPVSNCRDNSKPLFIGCKAEDVMHAIVSPTNRAVMNQKVGLRGQTAAAAPQSLGVFLSLSWWVVQRIDISILIPQKLLNPVKCTGNDSSASLH